MFLPGVGRATAGGGCGGDDETTPCVVLTAEETFLFLSPPFA